MQKNHLPDPAIQLQGFDDFVQRVLHDWKGRGVAVAVVKENEIIYAQGFGLRDEARGLPVTTQTLFPIASCTKAFTSAALAMLADQGKLNWDTPIREYISSFKLYDPFATERVTARDLVAHRTGLPRHDMVWDNDTTTTRQEFFERLQYLEPTKDLRGFWQYQNLMYMAAGYLVEVISGQTWEDFVHQHIFQPLGMQNSNFDIVQIAKETSDYSYPYRELRGEVQALPFYGCQGAIGPIGAIVSNVSEMSNWMSLHLNRGNFNGTRLISEYQMKQMHSPQMVVPETSSYAEIPYINYAMGWRVKPYRGYPLVNHSGGINGFRSLTSLFPREGIGIVVLSNLSGRDIPEILTYNLFERLVGLDETPWHERFMKEQQGLQAAADKGKEQSQAKRVAGAAPSHPLDAYTGEFEHPGYGTFTVDLNGEQLQGTFNDMLVPIRHYHYDIFELLWDWDEEMKVSFQTNIKGDIDTLIVPFEPTANDIVFKRQAPPEMRARAFLEQCAGFYEGAEMSFAVFFKDERTLSLSVSGEPEYELAPYKGSEFLAKGRSGISLEFQRDAAGAVTGVTATLPYGVFQAVKKA